MHTVHILKKATRHSNLNVWLFKDNHPWFLKRIIGVYLSDSTSYRKTLLKTKMRNMQVLESILD